MTITIITPPASEPVSLAEAKLYLRVDHAHEDDLIETLIGAAREAVEAAIGRALIARRVRESLDIWVREAAQGAVLGLGPVTNVVAVRLLADNGSQRVLDADRYRLDGNRDRPALVFASGVPATLRDAGGIEIEYDCGFADEAAALPVALRLATLQIVASLYELRQGEDGLPETARALMRPYAPARL
ncbi:MAG: phage head-tail connector protein [Phycisphaerales bacterium]|nr:phage head-tail connector protein [Hyphomonadaceae bacterium]